MKKIFILGNCYLNNRKCFWHIWPRWPWPLTQCPPKLLPRIVLEQKGKGYIRTDRRTDRQTNMCKAICSLFFEGVLWLTLSWGVRDDVGRTKLETQIKAKSHHLPKKDWQFPQQSPIHERLTRSHLNKQYSMLLASNSNLTLKFPLYIVGVRVRVI